MTEPTTVFDLSTPEKVAALSEELIKIDLALALAWRRQKAPADRATLTRRRDRIIAALDTLRTAD